MTCFSNEAHSMVKDCKQLVQTMPNRNPYEYPPELLSLQGKKRIFQLHFDPESIKERQVFILDTCWDDMPLLTSASAVTSECGMDSSTTNASQTITALTKFEASATPKNKEIHTIPQAMEPTKLQQTAVTPPTEQPQTTSGTLQIKEVQSTTQAKEGTKTPVQMDVTSDIATPESEPAETLELQQSHATPPTEQTSLPKTSKTAKEPAKKTARRRLLTETADEATTATPKKSKKED